MLSEQLTIVIPCKNEEAYIEYLLRDLCKQVDIKGTRVIIADDSTDRTPEVIETFKARNSDVLQIEVVKGGTVTVARNNGAAICTTPFILFIDADVRFRDPFHVVEAYIKAKTVKLNKGRVLMTSRLGSYAEDWRAELAYNLYNFIHRFLVKRYPFAIGAFFLVDIESFNRFNRFNELVDNSEDFLFSQNYKPDEFKVTFPKIFMDDRRFRKIGYVGFAKHLIKNFSMFLLKKNNYFYKKSSYWG